MKNKIIVGVFLITSVWLANNILAQQTNFNISKNGWSELKISLGADAVGKGETFVAKADNLHSACWNPAGLSQLKDTQIGLMHNMYVQEINLEYLAYAQKIFPGWGIGVNALVLNYGEMDRMEVVKGVPEEKGKFKAMTEIVNVGIGGELNNNLALGTTIKYMHKNIDKYENSALACDLGMLVKFLEDKIKIGLTLQNVALQAKKQELPMLVRAGIDCNIPLVLNKKDLWDIAVELVVPTADFKYSSINIGSEYWYKDLVAARIGYKYQENSYENLGETYGLSSGLSFKIKPLILDYALCSLGDLGLSHQIGVRFNF